MHSFLHNALLRAVSILGSNEYFIYYNSKYMSTPSYTFQTDWFSSSIGEWSEVLKDLKSKPDLNFLEIGSFEGRSAVWLLDNVLVDQSSRLTCIDTWKGSKEHQNSTLDFSVVEKNFDHNILLSGQLKKVTKIKDYSYNALRGLPPSSFHFIYIDGSHKASDVLEDAVLSFRLLKPSGIMIFDDYEWEPQYKSIDSPKIAIDSFVECYKDQLDVIGTTGQLTIRKRSSL